MLRRTRREAIQLLKRAKNNDKKVDETKSAVAKNEEKIKEQSDAVPSPPVTSSESGFISFTRLSYLTSLLPSLWSSSDATKEKYQKSEKRAKHIKITRLTKTALLNRTQGLVSNLLAASSDGSIMLRTRELLRHFLEYPESRNACKMEPLIAKLRKRIQKSSDKVLKEHLEQFFTVMGIIDPPKGDGIRILSIDGGGTRGMIGLDVLRGIERFLDGRKVVDEFDLVVGVSTGAIIAALLIVKRLSIEMCKDVYLNISKELFKQDKLSGVSGLLLSHSYYNTEKWKESLKNVFGEDDLFEISRSKDPPRLCIVSCIVNAPTLRPYVFRTYGVPLGSKSDYLGGCNHKLWEAVQASAAAPGYFEEVLLGPVLHQDGGVLTNNPTAIAVHEARMLWPHETIQCLVSVGNGRTHTQTAPTTSKHSTRLQEKILRIIDSATDTELVDLCMRNVISLNRYFRFNPYTTYSYPLDEIDTKKLAQMEQDAFMYVERNEPKFQSAAELLLKKPSIARLIKRKMDNILGC